MSERAVILIDMDCFYVQVEQRARPELRGQPCAVVQYNSWRGGGIIAVSYEARANGVSRNMRGDEAKQRCPGLHLVQVPTVRDKADLTRYREAGAEVIRVLSTFGGALERASIDEAYMDVTELIEDDSVPTSPEHLANTSLVGQDEMLPSDWLPELSARGPNERRLVRAAALVERIRRAVFEQTQFVCSAGIAHNKILAKFACGMHKPNRQTILPHSAVEDLFNGVSVKKIRHLGGKLGTSLVEELGVTFMGDLRDRFSERDLCERYGDKTGKWLFAMARGRDDEPVVGRQLPKSIGCSKSFPGTNALDTRAKVAHWLEALAQEMVERLLRDKEQNYRVARSLVLCVAHQAHPSRALATRTCALIRYDVTKVAHDAMVLLRPFNSTAPGSEVWSPGITYLGLSAGKFAEMTQDCSNIRDLFAKSTTSSSKSAASTWTASSSSSVTSASEPTGRKLTFFERLSQRQKNQNDVSQLPEPERIRKEPERVVMEPKEPEPEPEVAELKERELNTREPPRAASFFERRIGQLRETGCQRPTSETSRETVISEASAQSESPSEEPIFSSQTDFMLCEVCDERVLMFEMPEHSDRHVAERLHRELQADLVALEKEQQQQPSRPSSGLVKKRGRPPGSGNKSKRLKEEGTAFSLDKFLR